MSKIEALNLMLNLREASYEDNRILEIIEEYKSVNIPFYLELKRLYKLSIDELKEKK